MSIIYCDRLMLSLLQNYGRSMTGICAVPWLAARDAIVHEHGRIVARSYFDHKY